MKTVNIERFFNEAHKSKRNIPIWQQIDLLCETYGLNNDVKKEIKELSKISYLAGSKDCYNIYISNENNQNK